MQISILIFINSYNLIIEMHSNIARGSILPSLVHQCMHNQMHSTIARGNTLVVGRTGLAHKIFFILSLNFLLGELRKKIK